MRIQSVRHWLTPRCILVGLLLVVAPGAALAHLLVNWLPGKVVLMQLDGQIARDTAQLQALSEENDRLLSQVAKLRQTSAALEESARAMCLPARDRDGVFEQLAGALRVDGVAIEQLTLGEPGLYAAVSRSDLLACELVTIQCTGPYAGLAACLDRLSSLALPLRVTQLAWGHAAGSLSLLLLVQVPFVPDPNLAAVLADRAKLDPEPEHES